MKRSLRILGTLVTLAAAGLLQASVMTFHAASASLSTGIGAVLLVVAAGCLALLWWDA